ncbi:MAG: zinc-ribbon domain-containing protein [Lachnospiraceae bacterium]|nr:zinc-ribbon domain-containing protein [Lachnospiraceae bacterium]
MFCRQCGKELPPSAKFCVGCGAPVPAQAVPPKAPNPAPETDSKPPVKEAAETQNPVTASEPEIKEKPTKPKKQKKKISKFKIILLILLVLILAIVGVGIYLYVASPVGSIMTAVREEDFDDAVEIYNDDAEDSAIYSLICSSLLNQEISSVTDDFLADKISYETASAMLLAMSGLDNDELSDAAKEQTAVLTKLHESRETYSQAEELYEDGDSKEALLLYQQIGEDMPEYESAQAKIDTCRSDYKESVLAQTETADTQENYLTAMEMVSVALDVLGEDADLTQRLTALTEDYHALVKSEAMLEANAALENKAYVDALSKLEKALEILPEDTDLTALHSSISDTYRDVRIEEIRGQVEAKIAENDYLQAISILKEGTAEFPESTLLADLYASVCITFESLVTEQVVGLLENYDYDTALTVLESIISSYPDNDAINNLYDIVLANMPVKLNEFTIADCDNYYEITGIGIVEDTIGNVYSAGNVYEFDDTWNAGYAKYYLGGEYSTLKLTIAMKNTSQYNKTSRRITIYGDDDKVLYTTGNIGRTTAPFEITADVSDVQWLYIHCSDNGYDMVTPLLINPTLYK